MKQITIKEYLELSEEKKVPYLALMQHLKPKEHYKVNLDDLTYNEVKGLFNKLRTAKDEMDIKSIFISAFKITENDFLSLTIQKFFQIKKYLSEYFVFLHKRESELLQSVNADIGLWEMAGGKTLEEFSDVLPLSQLAKIYGGYPFDWGEKKYIEIIYLLRMNNKQTQVENEFNRLKNKK